jgi:alpha-L-fucosidase
MKYDQEHLRELLTGYGKIDIMFIDGPAEDLREVCWQVRPDVVVTRGAMETPEQFTPGVPLEGPWEGNMTMGNAWHYKPTNEEYKSGTELIKTLIETRAKGGNFLLNIGPHPSGKIPFEQERLMREIGLWNFVNGEAIYGARPWVVTNEGDVWFTKKKSEKTVYAFLTGTSWKWGEPNTITLKSVRATDQTKIDILGQSGKVLEYRTEVTPETTWRQDEEGLHIRATRAQRLYNNRRWPNPVVLRITDASPALVPPLVMTGTAGWDPASGIATLHGELKDLGDAREVEVGFQYRRMKGPAEMYEPDYPWRDTDYRKRSKPGL